MTPDHPKPPFPKQKQPMPGYTAKMQPVPDHGEEAYKGSGRLMGKKAIITGGDSGIGRAVAIAYAREGADLVISYLLEHEDAEETKRQVEAAGRKVVLIPGDIQDPAHCRRIVERTMRELGGIDILVNNGAHQASFKDIGDITDEEWELTFKVNIHAMFYLSKAAVPAYAAWQRHHQHRLDQFRYPQSHAAGLRHDQGRDPEFHGRPGATIGSQGDPRQCRCAGTDLDRTDTLDIARRCRGQFRQTGTDEASGPTRRTCNCLRDAEIGRASC